MIRAVFLDIDDTLLSFRGYVKASMREGFRLFGLPEYTEEMYFVFERENGALWRMLERGELTFAELQNVRWNRVFAALGMQADGHAFEEYFRAQLCTSAIPEDGAMELLQSLAPRCTLCAASNGPYEQQRSRLRLAGMERYFDHFFISERLGAQKPGAEFFSRSFQELHSSGLQDLRPEETVMVGDSETSDMAGGVRFGMHTVLYRPDGSGERPEGVEHVVGSLRDIPGVIFPDEA